MKNTAHGYAEPTPMSRVEVLDQEREQDERRRKWQAEQSRVKAKAQRALSQGPTPLTKDEVAEMERERKERQGEFLAAQEARSAERLKEIAST
jgi:hypothetical protein